MKPTVDVVRQTYELLLFVPVIKTWKLPGSNKIKFVVRADKDCYGWYEPNPDTIGVSTAKCSHIDTIIKTVGHEMIHLYLYKKHSKQWGDHEGIFKVLAERIANVLGYEPKDF